MKWWPKRVACLWLVISVCASTKSFAQDEQTTFAFANALMQSNDYEGAILNYQRVIHFSDNDSLLLPSYVHLADYWQNLDSFKRSNEYLQLAYFTAENINDKNHFAIRRSENFILQKQYFEALEELLSVDIVDNNTKREVAFYEAVIRFGMGQYDQSEILFLEYVDTLQNPQAARDVRKLFDKNQRLSRLNPRTAMIMSMIIPGSGQMYVGDFRNGINSLVLNGFFAWLLVNTTINSGILDGVASVMPWYFRYYMGGYQRAEKIAIEQVAKRRAQIYRQVIQTLPEN